MSRDQPRRMRRWGGYAVCVLALLGVAYGVSRAQKAPSQATPPPAQAVPVSLATVERRDVPILTRGIGTVQAFQSVLVQARVTGWLNHLAFTEGQVVKPGDLLAVIDPRPYAAALAQAQAKQAGDEATLANNQANLQRDAALAERSFASRQQVDNSTAAVRSMQATVQADIAAVQTAALDVSFCQITAPIEGVVGFQQVNVGNLVQAGGMQGIVTITQIHPISVIFTLPQSELPRVQEAQVAGKPQVYAYGQDGRTLLDTGVLLAPSNTIEAATGTVAMKATFPNPENKLWPGQFVNVRLKVSEAQNVPVIPQAAIQHGPDGTFVYVARPDSVVGLQKVTIGYQEDDTAVVVQGLNGGEQIVTSGQSRLETGTRIKSVSATTNG